MKPDKRKPETIIAELRRKRAELRRDLNGAQWWRRDAESRLAACQAELAEWKRRFDALLERTPKVPS